MSFLVVGLSHASAPVSVLERAVVSGDAQAKLLHDVYTSREIGGALILSTFAGASHELSDALLVNPYDVSQLADTIHRALEMSEKEQATAMGRMRDKVREHNIYRWAAHLLSDLTEIRVESTERAEAPQTT